MSADSCPPPSSFLARVLWLGAGLRVPRCWWPLGGSRVSKGGESADSDLSPSGSPVSCGWALVLARPECRLCPCSLAELQKESLLFPNLVEACKPQGRMHASVDLS